MHGCGLIGHDTIAVVSNVDIIRTLIQAGADPDVPNDESITTRTTDVTAFLPRARHPNNSHEAEEMLLL